MDYEGYLERMRMKPLTREETQQLIQEIDRLLKNGQHLRATMLYNTFFPESTR
jgi:uncharacterized protein Yka (UPF0111/DUF47 family)